MIWSNRRAVDQIVPSHPPEYPSPKIETYNPLVPKILIFRHLYSVFFKNLCYIGIGRYEKTYIGFLSVSADKKISYIGLYRYRPIWKKAYRSYTEMISAKVYANHVFFARTFPPNNYNISTYILDLFFWMSFLHWPCNNFNYPTYMS